MQDPKLIIKEETNDGLQLFTNVLINTVSGKVQGNENSLIMNNVRSCRTWNRTIMEHVRFVTQNH